jgi:hypothetical protein
VLQAVLSGILVRSAHIISQGLLDFITQFTSRAGSGCNKLDLWSPEAFFDLNRGLSLGDG